MRGRRIAPRAPPEKEFRDPSRQEGPSPINAADGLGASAESFSQRARRMSVHVPTAGRVQATSRREACGLRPRTLSQRREGSTARSPDKPCPGAARQVWPAAGGRSGNPGTVRARASLRSRPAAWRAARPRPWTEGLLPVPRRGTKRGGRRAGVEGCAWLVAAGAIAGRAAGVFHPLRGHARGPQVRPRAWIRGRSRRVPASAVPRRRLAVPPPGRGSQARLRARPR